MSENDFIMKLFIPNLRKIVNEYEIKYDRDDIVTSNNKLAEKLFDAACELIIKTGVYCSDTNRVIRFDQDDILEAVNNYPKESVFGEGRDRRVFRSRKPYDDKSPWCFVGGGITASSEEIAMAQVEGYGNIPFAYSISIPPIGNIKGMSIINGSPLEIYATIASVQAGRKTLLKSGRSGLPIMNLISSATSATSTISGSHPNFGLRQSDGWLIDFIAEFKVDFETFNKLAFILSIGGNVGSTAIPILGGYAGGPEGTAVIMVAYYLLGIILFRGTYHLTCPVHFRFGCSSTRECLCVYSIAKRAISQHLQYPDIGNGYASAGSGIKMYYYESACVNLCCVVSGYGGVETVHPAKGILIDGITPLDARFNAEIAHASAYIKEDKANEIAQKLLSEYENDIEHAPKGKRYQECYDVNTGKPYDEYVVLFNKMKESLVKIGIPFGK